EAGVSPGNSSDLLLAKTSVLVGPRGMRPRTALSTATRPGIAAYLGEEELSGRPDLNRGPHRPERCALPGCATPRMGSGSHSSAAGRRADGDVRRHRRRGLLGLLDRLGHGGGGALSGGLNRRGVRHLDRLAVAARLAVA